MKARWRVVLGLAEYWFHPVSKILTKIPVLSGRQVHECLGKACTVMHMHTHMHRHTEVEKEQENNFCLRVKELVDHGNCTAG